MPLILPPNLLEQSTLAKQWRTRFPTRDPTFISTEERQESKEARAAFFWATRQEPLPGAPEAPPCSSCGRATHGWCEGCYERVGPVLDQPYGAICSYCENTQLVCQLCQDNYVTWMDGHTAFLQQASEARGLQQSLGMQCEFNPNEEIVISGINGEPSNASFVNMETLAASSGVSPGDLIQQIREALQHQNRQ